MFLGEIPLRREFEFPSFNINFMLRDDALDIAPASVDRIG
jgi:hypothetical protein